MTSLEDVSLGVGEGRKLILRNGSHQSIALRERCKISHGGRVGELLTQKTVQVYARSFQGGNIIMLVQLQKQSHRSDVLRGKLDFCCCRNVGIQHLGCDSIGYKWLVSHSPHEGLAEDYIQHK